MTTLRYRYMAGNELPFGAPAPAAPAKTITLTIPTAFWQDHLSRDLRCAEDCPDQDRHAGETGTLTKSGTKVTLTEGDLAELESDARYYMTDGKYIDVSIGLISSARATVGRIAKATTKEES